MPDLKLVRQPVDPSTMRNVLAVLVVSILMLASCAAVQDQSVGPGGDTTSEEGSLAEQESSPAVAGNEESSVSEDALTEPVAFAQPTKLEAEPATELGRPVIPTELWQLTADPGTEWELPFKVSVPEGWAFDQRTGGFTDGLSSMSFETGCAGACEVKNWEQLLPEEGQFLDRNGVEATGVGGGIRGAAFSQTYYWEDPGVARTAWWHPGGGRYLGCTIEWADPDLKEGLAGLCGRIAPDFSTVVANTPTLKFDELLPPETQDIINNPVPDLERHRVPLEDKYEPEYFATLGLPDDVRFDYWLGVNVKLRAFVGVRLDAGCQGDCGAQDWGEKLLGSGEDIWRTRLEIYPVNDSPIESGWLLSGPNIDESYSIRVYRWNDDAARFFSCRADLRHWEQEEVDQVLGICLSARPEWFDL